MRPNGKWIDGIVAEGPVEDAARRSLASRLSSVEYWLPLAAHLADRDIEHVHRLRVSTRRSVAALKLFRDWLPDRPRRWIKKRLRKIRRAAGEARDLDVLSHRLATTYGDLAAPLVALIAQERVLVQPAIVAAADRARRDDRFVRKAARLLEGIGAPSDAGDRQVVFRDWAKSKLAESAACFIEAMPQDSSDPVQLHQFRIQAKQLRYTLELVAPAFGAELREKHYPTVESLQGRLGRIQDHAAAIARLENWTTEPRFAGSLDVIRNLVELEKAALHRGIGEFREWWTTGMFDELRSGLRSLAAIDVDEPSDN